MIHPKLQTPYKYRPKEWQLDSSNVKTAYTKLGITFFSTERDVKQIRPMDLFSIAQDIFDKDGARLENKDIAKKLIKMGKSEVEIIADPKYKYTLTAR